MNKLKKFNKSNKKNIMPLVALCSVVAIVSAAISYAVYQKEDEVLFINARVGEFETSSSDIELAMTLDGEDVDVPPSKGYYNVTVECDHADGIWESTDDKWGAYIYNISSNRVKCNISFETLETRPLSIVEIGDYISMTPTSTSYFPPSNITGYNGSFTGNSVDQGTLNPSELNLWRVIRKNEDGTVDVVSEYVSSVAIAFTYQIGYLNYVGGLNTIAAQYTNDKYVARTRHMGYSSQTEYCSSISSCPDDNGYTIDTDLVEKAIGNLIGKKTNEEITSYAIPSRFADWSAPSIGAQYRGRMVINSGEVYQTGYFFRPYDSTHYGLCASVRPILTLKSDVEIISGDGKSAATSYQLK